MERYGQILQPGAPPALPAPRFREMSWPAKALVTGVLLAAVARLLYDLAGTSFTGLDWGSLVVLTAGALLAQFFGVSVRRYAIYHVTPLFIFAALFLLGLGPVGIMIIISYAVGGWRRRQGWHIICRVQSNRRLSGQQISQRASAQRHRRYVHVNITAADGKKTTYCVRSMSGRLSDVPFDVCGLESRWHPRDKNPVYFISTVSHCRRNRRYSTTPSVGTARSTTTT